MAYASFYMTGASESLSVERDVPEELIFPSGGTAGPLSGITHSGSTRLTTTAAGVYILDFIGSIDVSVTSATLTVWPAVDGVTQTAWAQQRKISGPFDVGNVRLFSWHSLAAGEVLSVWVQLSWTGGASTANIIWRHAAASVRRVDL